MYAHVTVWTEEIDSFGGHVCLQPGKEPVAGSKATHKKYRLLFIRQKVEARAWGPAHHDSFRGNLSLLLDRLYDAINGGLKKSGNF